MEIETPSLQSFDLQSNHSFSFSSTASSQACSNYEMARLSNPGCGSTAMVVDSTATKSSGALFIFTSLSKPNSKLAPETKSSSSNQEPSLGTCCHGEINCATSESLDSPGAKSDIINDQENGSVKSSAAVNIQRVYRSYRTRRRLADTAVVAEELWVSFTGKIVETRITDKAHVVEGWMNIIYSRSNRERYNAERVVVGLDIEWKPCWIGSSLGLSMGFIAVTLLIYENLQRNGQLRRPGLKDLVYEVVWPCMDLNPLLEEISQWQAINFARLTHSTISFFDFSKPETIASRWSRVSLNASKVGKGLFEDSKAQKLAFQHWIEAIDPRHLYGHNLHIYYEEWSESQSGQPFFYWLNVGEGKEVDLKVCPRTKLRQECIKYLGPKERENYEYIIIDGKIIHKQTEKPLATRDGSEKAKWIFVMSTSKKFYANEKKKGCFHHSSFLAGGATLAAGRLVAENGLLKTISAYSGHYRPSKENLDCFMTFLKDNGVNLDEVEIRSATEDYENHDISKSSQEGSTVGIATLPEPEPSLLENPSTVGKDQTLTPDGVTQTEPTEIAEIERRGSYKRTLSGALRSPKLNVPKTAILQRINSKKAARSYQLGNQIPLKWSTGAGPRIGCIADYPVELRVQALEIVDLSPRFPPTPSGYRQTDPAPRFPHIPSGYRQSDLSPKFPLAPSGYRQPPCLISPASHPTSGFCCNDRNSLA